jgi:hypothetical protein
LLQFKFQNSHKFIIYQTYVNVEIYRDLQWQIYNVQRLHLSALEKIFNNGVLEANDINIFKKFEKDLEEVKEEMGKYLNKILATQNGDERIY